MASARDESVVDVAANDADEWNMERDVIGDSIT